MPSPFDPEVRAFLRHSMVALVATRSANERPFMTPLWFVADRGILFIATGAASWTSRNVSRYPEMALLFSGEGAGRTDRVLRLRGTATFRHGLPPWRRADPDTFESFPRWPSSCRSPTEPGERSTKRELLGQVISLSRGSISRSSSGDTISR
jgi:hypothetical protein